MASSWLFRTVRDFSYVADGSLIDKLVRTRSCWFQTCQFLYRCELQSVCLRNIAEITQWLKYNYMYIYKIDNKHLIILRRSYSNVFSYCTESMTTTLTFMSLDLNTWSLCNTFWENKIWFKRIFFFFFLHELVIYRHKWKTYTNVIYTLL